MCVADGRARTQLPCYSGITLPDLENDDAVQQSVESLVEISRDNLDIVAMALTDLVDKLSRVRRVHICARPRASRDIDTDRPV